MPERCAGTFGTPTGRPPPAGPCAMGNNPCAMGNKRVMQG
jgi:hypothetical protein